MREELERHFSDVILLPSDEDLAGPLQCHPDMIFSVLDQHLFLSHRYYETHSAVIDRIAHLGGFTLHPSEVHRNACYPNDVAFNIAVWHDCVIGRTDVLCPALLDFAETHGFRTVHVRQGYSGCSCLVTDRAVLTFDRGIANTLKREKIPCVLLESGGIALPGYDCGFPGGASGFYDGTVYLFGNTAALPCAARLNAAARRIVCLSDGPVTDYGGIRIFKKQ